MRRFLKLSLLLLLALVLLPASGYIGLLWSRPARTDKQAFLFRGVHYSRQARREPRPLLIHLVEIDLTAPGIGFLVTPGDAGSELDYLARTTSEFLTEHRLQLAINGSFFKPFYVNTIWDYYPHRGDPVDATGLSIANGRTYSPASPAIPALCLWPGQARIRLRCPPQTTNALAGGALLLVNGASVVRARPYTVDDLHPRTAVAVDESGTRLWLVVVDGRQPGYSEGVTMAELAEIVLALGAESGLNLDGGGSTTLVMAGPFGPQTLDAPIHTRLPMRQRPVANHLGVYALPLAR
jgi:hypothetical protein